MEQVAREVSARDLTVNIPRPSHRKLFVLLAVLAACTAAVCAVSPEAAGNALKRWVRPFNPPERYTFTQLAPTPDSLVIPMGESCLYEIRLAEGTKTRPQTAEYFFRNRVSQQAPLADGAYKIHIPPMQQADSLEFFAGDAVRRLNIIPKGRPSLLGAEAGVAYPCLYGARQRQGSHESRSYFRPGRLYADVEGVRLPAPAVCGGRAGPSAPGGRKQRHHSEHPFGKRAQGNRA